MNDIKQLSGLMNLDDSEMVMPSTNHKSAFNGFFRGNGNNFRFESGRGTTLIPTELKPAGDNQCIGHFFDELRQRLFWCNYNSNGNHGIYILDVSTGNIVPLIVVGAATDGDILGFTLTTVIHSMNLLYGGSLRSDGDILYYIDSLKRPTQINVDRYLDTPPAVTKRSYIDVIKAPCEFVPQVVYENDDNVTVNNLKGALYKFATVYVYQDNETPVFSSSSIVPLPYIIENSHDDSDITKNARIGVYVATGDETIKKIRIYGRRSTIDLTTDYFLIIELDKTELSIANDSIYKYIFYNNGQYVTVESVEDSIQLFDYTPDGANTQELLNGDTLIYGGITEGYDAVAPNVVVTVSDILRVWQYYNGTLFFGFRKSATNIVLYVTGTGVNDGSGNATTLTNAWATFNVVAQDTSFNDIGFFYTAGASAQTIATILTALSASATGQGWTVVATTTNTLELSFAGGAILASAYTVNTRDGVVRTDQDATYSLSEASRYSFGIQYFTSSGKTNGVTYKMNLSTNTLKDFVIVPLVKLEIYHRPPIWASYYHIVRTDTETYQKKTYWASSYSCSDNQPIATAANTKYAYVDIDNMTSYSQDLNVDGANVTYDFAKGDRIRFLGVYNNFSDPQNPFLYSGSYDYEIIGVKIDPFVNGIKRVGRFVQVVYPTNDISATFKFDGTPQYSNYYILLYTPKTTVSTDLQPFFEFGKRFGIANAGTEGAIHLGQETIQSVDLATPATITIGDGDLYYRRRNVPKSPTYTAGDTAGLFDGAANEATLALLNFDETVPLTISSGIINNQPSTYGSVSNPLVSPLSSDTDCFYNNTSSATTRVRLRMDVTVGSEDRADDISLYVKIFNSTPPIAPFRYQKLYTFTSTPNNNNTTQYSVDVYFDAYRSDKIFLMFADSISNFYAVTVRNFRMNVIDIGLVNLIEKTWNDYTPIIANSDGRATAIDKNAEHTYNPTLIRWGLQYQQNTNINNINRFKALNYDIIDSRYGDIQRFLLEGKLLYTYQNRRVGQHGVYARFITNNGQQEQLITTDEIVTSNNIQYLEGDYGVGIYPTGVTRGRNGHYFQDPVRGIQVRRASNGLEPISVQNKAQFYMPTVLAPFAKQWDRPQGGYAKPMGVYDYFEDEFVALLQERVQGDDTYDPITLSFNEKRNGYSSFFKYYPEWVAAVNQLIYSWLNGELYVHNNTGLYANYYGAQHQASIQLVFNESVILRKVFTTVQYISRQQWESRANGEIYTSEYNEQTGLLQISSLKASDYKDRSNFKNASLLSDANSKSDSVFALNQGDSLRGIYIVSNFTYYGTDFSYFYMASILSQEDRENFKNP